MERTDQDTWQLAYDRLNLEQKRAVDTIEGPVMVIAGPGTGKTQILTLRIVNILRRTDTAPESILALTFTKSGARAMRERLRQFIGAAAYRVPIMTFHSLCEQLIKEYPDAYDTIVGGSAATELEKLSFIEAILNAGDLSLLRPTGAPDFYLRPILSAISHMKQENISPDGLAALIMGTEAELANMPQYHEKGAHKGKERSEYTKLQERIAKQRCLLTVYRQYEAMMRSERRYDFDDMIVETVRVLQSRESVRLDLQERYQYILADEHQDVNGAQNEILLQLTSFHSEPNLFVVGDEKQAIYRFQGASLENFLFFEKTFPSTTVIALTHNYRSSQVILDAAHDLIKVEEGPLLDYRIPLVGRSEPSPAPTLSQYPHQGAEDEAIVESVTSALSKGESPEEIAIILHTNREVTAMAELLRQAGITVEASADGDILVHPLFMAAQDLLTAVVEPTNEVALARVILAPYWRLSATQQLDLLRARSFSAPLTQLMEIAKEAAPTPALPGTIAHLADVLIEAREAALTQAPQRVAAELFTKSGLIDYVTSTSPFEGARVIRRVYDEIESLYLSGRGSTLSAVVRELALYKDHSLPLTAPYRTSGGRGVQVMTAHKAKGLEFARVYIPHLTEEGWGGGRRPDYFKLPLVRTIALQLEANEDERRLLYVAQTRAKDHLLLSFSDSNVEGKDLSPSPFLANMNIPSIAVRTEVMTLSPVQTSSQAASAEVRAFLQASLIDRGLSATSLNNFIKDPWQYFYQNVVRLPSVQAPAQQFGTAMHAVLERLTKEHTRTGTLPNFSTARGYLEQQLGRLPLSPVEFSDLFAKGQESLTAYLPHLEATLPATTREEFGIKVPLVINHPELPELILTGNLDRLDFVEDGSVRRVVDYKTGRIRSRREIEGETKSGDGNYRRQLTFYSLLLEHYDDERYRCDTGVLSFIEPDKKGLIKEEEFVSTEDDRAALITTITEAVETILRGDFLFNEELIAQSEYAALAKEWQAVLRRG